MKMLSRMPLPFQLASLLRTEVVFSEAVAGISSVLHDSGLVVAVVVFGCGQVLLEAQVSLPGCFAYVCSIGVAGLVVCACAGCVVDDAGFVIVF